MLVGSDNILGPEQMVVDYKRELLTIGSCRDMTVPMTITPAGRVKRVVRAHQAVMVPPHPSPIRLRGKTELPVGRDLTFTSSHDTKRFGPEGGVLSHITDANMGAVRVNNTSNRAVTIAKNSCLGVVQDYEEEGCYAASPEYGHLAAVLEISLTIGLYGYPRFCRDAPALYLHLSLHRLIDYR